MGIFKTYFNSEQFIFLLTGSLLIIFSIIFHLKNKNKPAVLFLFAGSVLIYLFAALLDPFLNLWDERFHALVAKNLMNHPLVPTLFDDPVVDMAYDRWDRCHIWLHKQPLFLWQIMLSFKIFGVNELALRLPNVVLSSFLVVFSYRTGKLLINAKVGYYTAFLFSTSFFMVELISGRRELEHNTIAFLVYVSASLWAWTEYLFSRKWYWIVLIGIFSGFAILCKWLVGLLVYFGWGIYNLITYKLHLKKYKHLFLSLLITILIVLPWQILILKLYPAETKMAYNFFSRHFSEALDGHRGGNWYFFDTMSVLYGKIAPFIIGFGFLLFYRKIKDNGVRIAFISLPIIVYLFFSLARTKMENYTFVVALPVYICLACIIDFIIKKMSQHIKIKLLQSILVFLLIILVGASNLNIELLQEKHTLWKETNQYPVMLSHNKAIFRQLKDELPENSVLFNVKGRHYIESMFYSGFPSYNFIPSYYQYSDLKEKEKIIAIFKTENTKIPGYLNNDSTVIIINQKVCGYN